MSIPSISSPPSAPLPPPTLQNAASTATAATAATVPKAQSTSSEITASTAAPTVKDTPPDDDQLSAAVQKVQDFTQSLATDLKFNIDEESGRTVVKVIDSSTNEVIRQFPSEEMLALSKALDQITGLLIKQKA